ncbi:hypothetical protein [Phaffia rhodozyma]|uniref:Uncharacterized protein n=1 Tax=Phaffia rhodozyma TaxID=264483 RepID=A0A0F7STX7_PHARH|nr:hypothetical protein [Phaffia rhodozyma]
MTCDRSLVQEKPTVLLEKSGTTGTNPIRTDQARVLFLDHSSRPDSIKILNKFWHPSPPSYLIQRQTPWPFSTSAFYPVGCLYPYSISALSYVFS